MATLIYCADYRGYYPGGASASYFNNMWPSYIEDCDAFGCPGLIYGECYTWQYMYARGRSYNFNYRLDAGSGKSPIWTTKTTNAFKGYGGLAFCKPNWGRAANEVWVENPGTTIMLCESWDDANDTFQDAWACDNANCAGSATNPWGPQRNFGHPAWRHNNGMNIAWVDGHAGRITPDTDAFNCDRNGNGILGDTEDDNLFDLGPDTKELEERWIAAGSP